MPETTQVLASVSHESPTLPSKRVLGTIALVDGILAVTLVALVSTSWILLGIAVVLVTAGVSLAMFMAGG